MRPPHRGKCIRARLLPWRLRLTSRRLSLHRQRYVQAAKLKQEALFSVDVVGMNSLDCSGKGYDGDLYSRLIQRLDIALDEADTAEQLSRTRAVEVEVRGLSQTDLDLIKAYLDRDLRWLQDWHAAAGELTRIDQSTREQATGDRRRSDSRGARLRGRPPAAPARNLDSPFLCCALCDTPIQCHADELPACPKCGSRLYRPLQPG